MDLLNALKIENNLKVNTKGGLYNETSLDGIECFYTTFTEEQMKYIKEFTCKKGLLLSGGSDYHGKNKQNH